MHFARKPQQSILIIFIWISSIRAMLIRHASAPCSFSSPHLKLWIKVHSKWMAKVKNYEMTKSEVLLLQMFDRTSLLICKLILKVQSQTIFLFFFSNQDSLFQYIHLANCSYQPRRMQLENKFLLQERIHQIYEVSRYMWVFLVLCHTFLYMLPNPRAGFPPSAYKKSLANS